MSRASVATIVALAVSGLAPSTAGALPSGYGKGASYCSSYGNRPSRYSFDGVYACASTASQGPTTFDSAGGESFQCVELSARFLWAIYGIWAGPGSGVQSGADLVSVVHQMHPSIRVGHPGPHSVPVAGDIVSLGPGGAVNATFGHTAVVVSASARTGYVTIISQNLPPGAAGKQTFRVGLRGRHNGRVLLNGIWTTASWLRLRHRPRR